MDHFRRIGAIRDKDFPASVQNWLNDFRLVNPIKYVARITPRPLLLVHGSQDEIVDVSDIHRLSAQAGEPKQIIIIDGAGNGLRQNKQAMAAVIAWLKSKCQGQQAIN